MEGSVVAHPSGLIGAARMIGRPLLPVAGAIRRGMSSVSVGKLGGASIGGKMSSLFFGYFVTFTYLINFRGTGLWFCNVAVCADSCGAAQLSAQ